MFHYVRRLDDFWAWNFERNGIFSVRSAYRMLVDTKRRRENWLEGNAGTSDFEAEVKAWTSMVGPSSKEGSQFLVEIGEALDSYGGCTA